MTSNTAPDQRTDLDRLLAVHRHATEHGITDTILSVGPRRLPVSVDLHATYGDDNVGARRNLVTWATSLGVTELNQSWDYGYRLVASGTLADGTTINVQLADKDETRRPDATQPLAEFTARLPLPRLHLVSADCWCTPTWNDKIAKFEHPTDDGSDAAFEPSDGDQVDADGYSREDHR